MPAPRIRKGYVDAPTGQVHFRVMGEGLPLLLLHQSPNSSMMFEKAYPLLAAAGVRAIGMDTPGFGMSDVPDPRPSIDTYARVIPYLLDALGVARTAVLGHHTGSATAVAFALAHPDRVTKLILNGPPLYTEDERRARLERAHRGPIPLQPDGSHLIDRWNRRLRATPGWTDLRAMHRGVVQTLLAGDTEWYGHLAAFEYELLPRFLALAVPTMILTNTGDDLYAYAQRARDLRPDFRYVELVGGTHDIVDEQPEAWTQAVVAFVKDPA
ncbi:MAG: alpha/beta hydrolase [Dehalococcoidia bacterium]|nr:alpha/beta hydrolase [Dehalococcoidia bacterium]